MTRQTDIYNFMNGRDCSASFSDASHNSEYSFNEFLEVENETKRVKNELTSKKNGTFLLEPKVPAVKEFDDDGNDIIISEEVPAVYFEYTTDEDLINSMESFLDVTKLLGEL